MGFLRPRGREMSRLEGVPVYFWWCAWYINKQDYNLFQFEVLQFVLYPMKRTNNEIVNFVSYLDVSEYIIKEPSPLLRPSPAQRHHHEILAPEDNFELQSIEASPSQVMLTPITSGLIRLEMQDIMDDFMLEPSEFFSGAEEGEHRRRRGQKMKMQKSSTLELFRLESDLDRIIEYDEQQSYLNQLDSEFFIESEKPADEDNCGANSNTFFTVWAKKTESKEQTSKDIDMQYQTTIEPSNVDYTESIEYFNNNPKLSILTKLNDIQALNQDLDSAEKKNLIKKYLETYLLDYEFFCFEEAWKELDLPLAKTFSLIKEGIEETFGKKIGALSFENRRVKLLKYLEKKRRRIWRKKVSYDCRKKVADGRLRIKGKFVTREQACEQLGLESLDNYSSEEIKEMLQRKIDENLKQINC